MLNTFLTKIEGLFDRRFLQAYWLPVFVAAAAALGVRAWAAGLDKTWAWWQSLGPAPEQKLGDFAQLWVLLALLVVITVVAYLLQALTRPLVQGYEGYWPPRLRRMAARLIQRRWRRLRAARTRAAAAGRMDEYAPLQDRLYYSYPPQEEQVMPTRLGNVLRAAEVYSGTVYGMDAVFWWPRLWAVLPDGVQKGIEASMMPVITLLNLATLLVVVTVGGAIYLARTQTNWWPPLIAAGVGAVLVWAGYWGAVAQAREYGQYIRMAVDLYRLDLLKALHQILPQTPQEERVLWDRLSRWLYNQDRGAIRGLTYDFDAPPKNEPAEKEREDKPGGWWGWLRRLWGGGKP